MPRLGDEAERVRSCGAPESFNSASSWASAQRRVAARRGRGHTALGAVGGAIAGNACKGAAIGAAGGGLLGVMRRNDQIRQDQYAQQQWAQQNAAQYEQHRSDWLRAVKACLTGRGYTVQ